LLVIEKKPHSILKYYYVLETPYYQCIRRRDKQCYSDGCKIDHSFVQRLYSAIELKRLMLATGFSSVEIYGDFDFSPYNEKARTMVLVARK